jgi:uncharacterized membrane protein YbhN (UPF0104 family)
VLAAVVAVGLGLYADFGDLVDALGRFRWELLPLALALTCVNYVLRFLRWQVYLRRLAIDVPWRRSLTTFVAGLTMTISPAKLGEVMKSGLLRRSFGIPVRRTAPIVLVERITDALGVVLLAAIGGAGAASSWPLLVITVAGSLALVAAVRTRLFDRWERVREARAAAADLVGAGMLASMSVLAAVSWFFECLAAQVCVRGLGLHVSLADTVVVFSLGSLAGAISFLPGGLGVAEGSMTGLFQTLAGVGAAAAAAATVLIRLSTLWFSVALGLGALALEQRLAARYAPEPADGSWRRSSIR